MSAIAPDLQLEVFEIGIRMKGAGLPADFVARAVRTAIDYEGVYDLLVLWRDETESGERDEIVADVQDMIDETSRNGGTEAAYVRFDDLEAIARQIRKFKDALLWEVNQRGGITRLSELSGIPQPSLSRFFNSASMPRRGTLQKIARALRLDAVKVATEWTRE